MATNAPAGGEEWRAAPASRSKDPHPDPVRPSAQGGGRRRRRSPRTPSSTTSTACCTTRSIARNTRINLKREFPRIPFYPDFWRMGRLGREADGAAHRLRDGRAVAAGAHRHAGREGARRRRSPKAMLKADKDNGTIRLDSETQLSGIPRGGVDLPARQPLGARMDTRPVQGKDAEGPDDPREVQHLPLRRLQGEGDRPPRARHARERRDGGDHRGDEGRKALKPTPCHPLVCRACLMYNRARPPGRACHGSFKSDGSAFARKRRRGFLISAGLLHAHSRIPTRRTNAKCPR